LIAIVDYRAGNLTSVKLALEYLQAPARATQDPGEVLQADRVIFPGVGAAKTAMANLDELGLIETLKTAVARGTPFLGICLGMQVIFDKSEEDGGTGCIGIVPGTVERFRPKDRMCKIPQIGWNRVHIVRDHPLLDGVEEDSEFYFVHSFYPSPSDKTYVIGETEYADTVFSSIAGKGNLFATQFHPERSGRIGLQILKNFSQWDGTC
jgi:imidazole glycerol-phosphate synthase subunit HisH